VHLEQTVPKRRPRNPRQGKDSLERTQETTTQSGQGTVEEPETKESPPEPTQTTADTQPEPTQQDIPQSFREQTASQFNQQIGSADIQAEDLTRTAKDGQTALTLDQETKEAIRTRRAAGAIGGTTAEQREFVKSISPASQDQILAAAIIEEETGRDVDPRTVEDANRIIDTLGGGDTTFNPINQTETRDAPDGLRGTTREGTFQTQTTVAPTAEESELIGESSAEAVQTLTTGGLLSEATEQTVNQLAQRYSEASQFVGGQVGGAVDTVVRPVTGEEGETAAGAFTEGAVTATGEVGNVPAFVSLGESGVEAVQGTASLAQQGDVGQAFQAGGQFAGTAAKAAAERARENPVQTVGALAGGVATSAGAGFAAGKAIRFGRQRVRTFGSDTFEIESGDIVNPQTGRVYDPNADTPSQAFTQENRFPGAQDDALYTRDPAQAVRAQADEFTPGSVEQRFEGAGVTEGTTLKKAIEVEPEGPGVRRAGGFATQAGSYESPGGFAGPELSPNFLGDVNRGSQFSLRPGIPDTGDQATGVLVRTRVENPDASNLDEFNQELLDREGETTARTKPASEVNTGEAEAVIPPEAEFTDIGNRGTLTEFGRRAGIGSDFSVRFGGRRIPFTDRKIGGKKVPLRPVADPDLVDSSPSNLRRLIDDERASVGGRRRRDVDADTQTLGEIRRPIETPTDRPAPVAPVSGGSLSGIGRSQGIQGERTPSEGTDDSSPTDDERRPDESQPRQGSPTDFTFPSIPFTGGPSNPTGSPGDSGPDPSDGIGGPTEDGGPAGGPAPSDYGGNDRTPFGGGGTGTGEPSPPQTPSEPNKGPRDIGFNIDKEDDEQYEQLFAGAANQQLTDFLNPLSGERLQTEADPSDEGFTPNT